MTSTIHVTGQRRLRQIARARQIFFRLMRRHVWLRTVPNGTQGQMPMAIVFGDVEPFPNPGRPRPVQITTRMLAWLTNRTNAAVCTAERLEISGSVLDAAERYLSEVYPPGRIEGVITFRSKIRSW